MVDPETFSSITRTFLRINNEKAKRRIELRKKMEKLLMESKEQEQID